MQTDGFCSRKLNKETTPHEEKEVGSLLGMTQVETGIRYYCVPSLRLMLELGMAARRVPRIAYLGRLLKKFS